MLQFLVGGMLLILVIRWHALDVAELLRKLLPDKASGVVNRLLLLAVGVFAVMLIFEPLIPGHAVAEIHAPATYPTTLENLSVRVTPIGCGTGAARSGALDRTGVALVPVDFHVLQEHMLVEILDATQDPRLFRHKDVSVSVLQRLGFSKLVVSF
jgi:hypothetical protein